MLEQINASLTGRDGQYELSMTRIDELQRIPIGGPASRIPAEPESLAATPRPVAALPEVPKQTGGVHPDPA
jgi:hypothetical protein